MGYIELRVCGLRLVLVTLYFYYLSYFPRRGSVYWWQTFEAVFTGNCEGVQGAMLLGALKKVSST